jgi:uncharacterized protein (TIGR03084 family)
VLIAVSEVDVADPSELLADLAAEGAALEAVVAGLEDTAWLMPTPAEGWTIAHSIAHLAWTDGQAEQAVRDPEGFRLAAGASPDSLARAVDDAAAQGSTAAPEQLLARWKAGRAALAAALTSLPAGTKLPWFGPPMSVASMATARLMETWAHGQDVADTLEVTRPATDRIRHVAHIGVRARDFAYRIRGEEPPADQFRVELLGPSGAVWTWGPEDAGQRVIGSAQDFGLLVTQRRHRADLALVAQGGDADHWLDIAQAFAGPPGAGRRAGQFRALDNAGRA